MRFLIAISYLILTLDAPSLAQDQAKIDSLLGAYRTSNNPSDKISTLKALFWKYYYTNPNEARRYVDEMEKYSKAKEYISGLWTAYNLFGILEYGQSRFDSARFWFDKGMSLSDNEEYYEERIYSLNYAGHSYRMESEYSSADSCFFRFLQATQGRDDDYNLARAHKALAINSQDQNIYSTALQHFLMADSLFNDTLHYETAEVLQNMGIIYKSLDNYKSARKYAKESLVIYEALNDDYGIYAIQRSLGSLELEIGHYKNAEQHLTRAFSYYKGFNDPLMAGSIARMLGRAYLNLRELKKAEEYYQWAIKRLKGIELGEVCYSYLGLGDVFKEKGVISRSMLYYDSAYQFAIKNSSPLIIMDVIETLAKAHYDANDLVTAYDFQQRYHHISDSMNTVKSSKMLHELEAKYQNDKKEREIQLLTTQNLLAEQEKEKQLYFLIAIIGITILTSVILYILYRNRQKVASKLQELDGIKSNFFANISHEFRTPITLIKGPVEDQLARPDLDKKSKENLGMVHRNADRLLSLVDQLLDLSKLEAKSMNLQVVEVSAFSELGAIGDAFKYAAKQKQIDYQIDIPNERDQSWLDKNTLEKIASNLLSNAIKYTEEKGIIKYVAEIAEGKLILTVSNTGEGLSVAEINRIQDRFYQMDTSNEGAGIGLSLVKELATLHKGNLAIKSEVDGWTDFEVSLPVTKKSFNASEIMVSQPHSHKSGFVSGSVQDDKAIIPNVDAVAENYDDDKPILLVVEDSIDLRSMIHGFFKDAFTVLEAENGEEGIDMAVNQIPDVIISDVMMPVKDGIQLARALKSDERTSHIPIVLLTAKAGNDNVLAGLETGADDYVTKPFNKDVLKTRVRNLVEIRDRLRQRYSQEVILKPKDIAITPVDEKFLERIQKLLDEQLTEPSFNAEKFAREIGMSRMQLHRKLKALLGLTTTEFIRSQRLKMAAYLLETSDINVSEVGYEVGFNDHSYFSKCFKEVYGCTPSQFIPS
ncbi:MAG: response regulator [Bacteroidota bacterium]